MKKEGRMAAVVSIEREPLVRSEVVAAFLGVTKETVQRWSRREDNPIPCQRFGLKKFVRYRMSQVEAWAQRSGERDAA